MSIQYSDPEKLEGFSTPAQEGSQAPNPSQRQNLDVYDDGISAQRRLDRVTSVLAAMLNDDDEAEEGEQIDLPIQDGNEGYHNTGSVHK